MSRKVCAPVVSGPLARWAAGYGSWLAGRGYVPLTVRRRLQELDRLSRWLEGEGLDAGELTPDCAARFLRTQSAAGCLTLASPRSVTVSLEYLREVGAVPVPAPSVAKGPVEEVLAGYCGYLVRERGLADLTIACYERDARLFLSGRQGPEGLQLQHLSAADVNGFLVRECSRRSVGGARALAVALRSLLRYLHMAGVTATPLQWAVPGVANQRDRSLPRGLEPAVVARLLESCDRRRTIGRRNHAIMLLLVRLGLRAGEVAALQLDDVDWRRGEVLIRGKGNRHDVLPLPADVGEALVCYLRCRRPPIASRALFLRVLPPIGPLSRTAVSMVVRLACVDAGVPPVGSHRLRHTAATGMLRAGASMPEIAEVLRHHRIETTGIYAKVDHVSLRALAQPWPGGFA